MAIIAIDFDGTIRNWDDDQPLPRAKDAICNLREKGHKIIIHSCNNPNYIEKWMRNNNIPFDWIWGLDKGLEGTKPVADAYIDDRAVGFRGNWTDTLLETLRLIKP